MVRAEEVADLLGVHPEEFYRKIYAADNDPHSMVSLRMATEVFDPGNVGELVSLVEIFVTGDVEKELYDAGVFLPYERQAEVVAGFLETAAATARDHPLDESAFVSMLRTYRRYDTARRAYLDTHFPTEDLRERAVENYCRETAFAHSGVARVTIRTVLDTYLARRVLEEDVFLAAVLSKLRNLAVEEGYLPRPARDAGVGAELNDEVTRAREVFGLPGPITRAALRDRYRQLMKRFHPDVNPHGLERAKEISAAYSVLAELRGTS